MQPCQENNRSFFGKLQEAEGLDLRDARGKRHDLAVILMGVLLAILCNRDGNMSSIHRHMKKHYKRLMFALNLEVKSVVSRAQLPRVLEKVSVSVVDNLIFENYGTRLNAEQKQWFSTDGKDLKGSIETGAKRGEAIVQAVRHEGLEIQCQTYYSGRKESEVTAVRELLKSSGLCKEKVSLDALHCKPKTLGLIEESGGIYLVGLKNNQKELLNQVKDSIGSLPLIYQSESVEKGHGRIETRNYQVIDIQRMENHERWESCDIKSLVKVSRDVLEIKSEKRSIETSYYISNQSEDVASLCAAVRGHWSVETNNHIRDVTLKEDKLRSKNKNVNRVLAGLRSLVLQILKKTKCLNKRDQIEEFADDFDLLLNTIKTFNFL
jgi:predicted transposase YbfD/YdcC